ncbi:hypothetical protein KC330_g3931 [Hortaea werneckii]|nr:hypothetical protein KC330_g3931 [Hortaea werneckii]
MSASGLIYSHIAEQPSSILEVVARNAWLRIREVDGYWQTLPEDIAIDPIRILSVNGITAQALAVSLGLPLNPDTPNHWEATTEQHEAQQLVVNSTSYGNQVEQWPQLPDAELGCPDVDIRCLSQKEPLAWDCEYLMPYGIAPGPSGT